MRDTLRTNTQATEGVGALLVRANAGGTARPPDSLATMLEDAGEVVIYECQNCPR